MFNYKRQDTFNFYESFSDLIFCTLVLFLVLVLFLALNVNDRIKNVTRTKQSIQNKQLETAENLKTLQARQKELISLTEEISPQIEQLEKLKIRQAQLEEQNNKLKSKLQQIEDAGKKATAVLVRIEELKKEEAEITKKSKALDAQELEIARQEKEFQSQGPKMELYERIQKYIEAEKYAKNKLYDTAGDDDDSGLVPCRWRYHVRLILNKRGMLFEGKSVRWRELPQIFTKIPNRQHTVLEVVTTNKAQAVMYFQKNRFAKKLDVLCSEYGFEYLSFAGVIKDVKFESKGKPKLIPVRYKN